MTDIMEYLTEQMNRIGRLLLNFNDLDDTSKLLTLRLVKTILDLASEYTLKSCVSIHAKILRDDFNRR